MTSSEPLSGAAADPVPARVLSSYRGTLTAMAALVLANSLLLAPLPLEIRLAGALLLFVALPGRLFVDLAFVRGRPSGMERLLLGLGVGYALATLLGLLLAGLVHPISALHLLAAGNLLCLGLLAGGRRQAAGVRRFPKSISAAARRLPPAALVLAVAAPLRLLDLGWSEFQGDEAKVVLRSLALLQGAPDALLAHRKPPGEILLNALFAGSLGTVNELAGRLPFGLAGVAGVLAFWLLGRSMFGRRAGLIAALLLAVNGFFVAFGRILQYQSVALLLDTLALLCLLRFARRPPARSGWALVGGLLLAGAALTAFSAIFLLPVAALALAVSRQGRSPARLREQALWLWPLAPAALGGLLLLTRLTGAGFDLTDAWRYLGPRLGADRPYFNWDGLLLATNLYTSSPYLAVTLGAGALLPVGALLARIRRPAAATSSGRPGSGLASGWLALDARNLFWAAIFGGALALLLAARRSLGWKLAALWLAGPLLTHLFLVRLVATHWREIFPGLLLLIAGAAAACYARLPPGAARRAAATLGALFLVASASYVYVAWVRSWPEYMLQYPQFRHPLDVTSLETRSAGGTFGAARRHGWKTVGDLIAEGQLPADYATNERPAEAAWYTKRREVCLDEAALYLWAPTTPRDRQAIERAESLPGFTWAGRIEVAGRPGLGLLLRALPPTGERVDRAEDHDRRFDRLLGSSTARVGGLYRPSIDVVPECRR